jgi:hypothetical protein
VCVCVCLCVCVFVCVSGWRVRSIGYVACAQVPCVHKWGVCTSGGCAQVGCVHQNRVCKVGFGMLRAVTCCMLQGFTLTCVCVCVCVCIACIVFVSSVYVPVYVSVSVCATQECKGCRGFQPRSSHGELARAGGERVCCLTGRNERRQARRGAVSRSCTIAVTHARLVGRMQCDDDWGCSCPSPLLHATHDDLINVSESPPSPPHNTIYWRLFSLLTSRYRFAHFSATKCTDLQKKHANATGKRRGSCSLALPFPPTFSPKPCPFSPPPPPHIADPPTEVCGGGGGSRWHLARWHLAGVLGRLL